MNADDRWRRSRAAGARPRVSLTYPCGEEERRLPFVVGVLADLSGTPPQPGPTLRDRKFVPIDRDNFDAVFESANPALSFTVDNRLPDGGPTLTVNLRFRRLADFGPEALAQQVEPLRRLLQARAQLGGSLGKPGTDDVVWKRRADIDAVLGRQLNTILHARELQRLEATWRGLHYLVQQSETNSMLVITVLNVGKEVLREDFERVKEFEQSALFEKVYRDPFGRLGAAPFGALIGDYEFSHRPSDLLLLERIAGVAAAAHAPFIAAASPELLAMDNFHQLSAPRDLARVLESAEYRRWKAFRSSEDSRFAALTLPRILLRVPYDDQPVGEGVAFREDAVREGEEGADPGTFLWGNASWAMAVRLTGAFALYGWCSTISGDSGGIVDSLPNVRVAGARGSANDVGPVEVMIDDRREIELFKLGFTPLLAQLHRSTAVFFSAATCHKPPVFLEEDATATAKCFAQLPYVLMGARFAHHLAAMVRDWPGRRPPPSECQRVLNEWIQTYVAPGAGAADSVVRPLEHASVDVEPVPGRPGTYHAILRLRPSYQLAAPPRSGRFVVRLAELAPEEPRGPSEGGRATVFRPECAMCGQPSATIEVVPPHALPAEWSSWEISRREAFKEFRAPESFYLLYSGPGGSNGWVGDPIDSEHAARIITTFSSVATAASIEAVDFYDGAGFCSYCEKFYCPTHWSDSATGYGMCPRGHGKSLDPHWYPEYPESEARGEG